MELIGFYLLGSVLSVYLFAKILKKNNANGDDITLNDFGVGFALFIVSWIGVFIIGLAWFEDNSEKVIIPGKEKNTISDNEKWVPIPEGILDEYINKNIDISLVCPNCHGNIERETAYPYAYDTSSKEVIYAFIHHKQCCCLNFLTESQAESLKAELPWDD
jgi:hypothetical protein